MSTNKTQITSTTSNNKVSDNKSVFGPLGKYAVVAVIMVSVIVTTAILLDKELNTDEDKVAAIDNEVAAANMVALKTTTRVEDSNAAASIAVTPETNKAQDTTGETSEVQAHQTKVAVAIEKDETIATVKETIADSSSYAEQVSNSVLATSTQTTAKIESTSTDTIAENSVQERQSQYVAGSQNQQWLAPIEAYKLEQKQYMTEMFTRIKALESKQLDRYKERQEKQIQRLREQTTQQQQLIETLVLRNQERFDMRAASMQRHQEKREQMLNRI